MALDTREIDNGDLLAAFEVEHFDRHSISQLRRQTTIQTLNRLAAIVDGSLADMTPSNLMEWQGAELNRGICPNTLRERETMVSAFLNWAGTTGVISYEKTTQLKSVSSARGAQAQIAPRPYKPREIEHFRELLDAKFPLVPPSGQGMWALRRYFAGMAPLRTHARRHARRLQFEAQVSLALEEGLRRIEIHRLTLPQVHYDNEAVVVLTAKGQPGQRREREVPYTAHSRQCVQEWLEFRKLMAPGHERPWLRLTADSINGADVLAPQTFKQFGESLNVFGGGYTWHRFRHTFATERLRAGLPLEKLQIMLGHARLEQTLAYTKIVNADVQRESERTELDFERALGLVA